MQILQAILVGRKQGGTSASGIQNPSHRRATQYARGRPVEELHGINFAAFLPRGAKGLTRMQRNVSHATWGFAGDF